MGGGEERLKERGGRDGLRDCVWVGRVGVGVRVCARLDAAGRRDSEIYTALLN